MTHPKDTLRLASIVEDFNRAVVDYIESDTSVQHKLQVTMDAHPEIEEEITTQAEKLFEAAAALAEPTEEEEELLAASFAIAFINTLMLVVQKAGLEDDVAKLFPDAEKTEENATAFKAAGAPNLARLCLK